MNDERRFSGQTLADLKAGVWFEDSIVPPLVAEIERLDAEVFCLKHREATYNAKYGGRWLMETWDAELANNARRDTLRQVREWCEAHVPRFADLGYTKTNFQRISWPLLRAELDRLEQETPAEPEKEKEPCSTSSSTIGESCAASSSGTSSATGTAGEAAADPPLPPEGMHLLPKGDGHVVRESEMFWGGPRWVSAVAYKGLPSDDEAWYAVPDPPDWPKLLPGTRRINAWDVPREEDLFYTESQERWCSFDPNEPPLRDDFYAHPTRAGRYARKLPQPEPPAEPRACETCWRLDVADCPEDCDGPEYLHWSAEPPAEERVREDRPDKAKRLSGGRTECIAWEPEGNGIYAMGKHPHYHVLSEGVERVVNDHAERLDRIEGQIERLIQAAIGHYSEEIAALKAERDALQAKLDALVFAVATKYPGEDRYDTALRYIREREMVKGFVHQVIV